MSNISDIVRLLQFTLCVGDEALTCLLNILAERNINIRAIAQIRTEEGCNLVKFIPNIPGEEQGLEAVLITRQVLEFLCIFFTEQIVLSVGFPSGVPGQLAAIQRLFFGRVEVRASYIDETLDQIYEVNNIDLAERILRNASTEIPVQTDCARLNQCCDRGRCDNKFDNRCHGKCDNKHDGRCDNRCSKKKDRCQGPCRLKCPIDCHQSKECHEKKHKKHHDDSDCSESCSFFSDSCESSRNCELIYEEKECYEIIIDDKKHKKKHRNEKKKVAIPIAHPLYKKQYIDKHDCGCNKH